MSQLLDEARRMPHASVAFARGVSEVRTPTKFLPLREHVRKDCRPRFAQLQAAINERFGTDGGRDDYVNVFYAAGEMALMEHVARKNLGPEDRRVLRRLWEHLLAAR